MSLERRTRMAEARGLYLVITRPRIPAPELARHAVARRVPVVQLREHGLPDSELLALARAVGRETRGTDTLFIVNDRPDIALAAEADGVHLGRTDIDPESARRIVGDAAVVGLSVTGIDDAIAATSEPVDYLGVGPIFATATKADAAPPIGLVGLTQVAQVTPRLSRVAIGGLSEGNVEQALRAGAHLVAVVSAVCHVRDPLAALDRLLEAVEGSPTSPPTMRESGPRERAPSAAQGAQHDIDTQVNLAGLRHCPRCAAPLEETVVRLHPRLVCASCGYVFYLTPAPVTCVVVARHGELLLVRRRYPPKVGDWCLPAGFVEVGESPSASAVREVREETGLEVAITGLVDSWASNEDPRTPVVSLAFAATVVGGTLSPGDDALEAAFFTRVSLPSNIAFSTHRDLISRHFERPERRR